MQAIISNAIQNYGRLTTISMAMTGAAAIEMGLRTIVDLTKSNKEDLTADLGGSIFYSLCAANIVPGTARIGAVIFTGYSLYTLSKNKTEQEKDYFTTKITRFPCYLIGEVLENLALPQHPVWIGVAFLATAIAIYKLPSAYQAIMQGQQ